AQGRDRQGAGRGRARGPDQVRPDPRVRRPPAGGRDPRGAGRGRAGEDPQRAQERDHQAVPQAVRHGGRGAGIPPGRAGRDRAQGAQAQDRRPRPAHHRRIGAAGHHVRPAVAGERQQGGRGRVGDRAQVRALPDLPGAPPGQGRRRRVTPVARRPSGGRMRERRKPNAFTCGSSRNSLNSRPFTDLRLHPPGHGPITGGRAPEAPPPTGADMPERPEIATLPVLPLRDVVVFPHMVIPLFVGREKSIRALELAMEGDRRIALVAQKSAEVDDPGAADLYGVGTLATVLQLLKLPDGTIKVLVEGVDRATVDKVAERDGTLTCRAQVVEPTGEREPREIEAVARSLMSLFEQYVKSNRKLPPELLQTLSGIEEPGRLADTIAAHLGVRLADKQRLLETVDVFERLELLVGLVDGEIDVQQMEKRIRGRVKSQMEKSQREYYLNEQMKAIQKELGEMDDAPNDLEEIARRIAAAGMPKAVEAKARAEFNKLKQ